MVMVWSERSAIPGSLDQPAKNQVGIDVKRILLVEDDPMIGRSLTRALHEQGTLVDWALDAREAIEAWRTQRHEVVLLDLGLPDLSGVEVLRNAREENMATPVVVITARADVESRVAILDLGADDYIVKPFELRELFARVRAVLRRHQTASRSTVETGEIRIDLAMHTVSYRGKTLRLPTREFALLHVLVREVGKIVSREVIEKEIYLSPDEIGSNAVDVLIHNLRRKFDKDIIRNVRGAGWLVMRDPR